MSKKRKEEKETKQKLIHIKMKEKLTESSQSIYVKIAKDVLMFITLELYHDFPVFASIDPWKLKDMKCLRSGLGAQAE